MPRIKLAAALMASLLAVASLPLEAEVRAIWVLPWSTNTPAKIDAFLAAAENARQTDVFIEVRYRADALYQTNRVPDAFPNPEPPSHLLKGSGFDTLGHALREGHKRNLRVHAWFVAFNATPVDAAQIADNYIFRNHPDWITYDNNQRRQRPTRQMGYFVDPGLPEVQQHLLNVIGDLASGYPELDGLHLDYIRYPNASLGFHPLSRERKLADPEASGMSWNDWRVRQVTTFVERTAALLDSLSPHLTLSAAVIPEYQRAVDEFGQDWLDWLRRGIVDQVYPMAYQTGLGDFSAALDTMASMGRDQRIIVGIRAWSENGSALYPEGKTGVYSLRDVRARIDNIRQRGFGGIALFSWDGLVPGNALGALARSSYSEWTIAALEALEFERMNPTDLPVDILFRPGLRSYDLELQLPEEGRWLWELRDGDDQVLYHKSRFYLKGYNRDRWNGVLENAGQIPPGDYLLSLWREQDGFQYVLPVTLPGFLN